MLHCNYADIELTQALAENANERTLEYVNTALSKGSGEQLPGERQVI